MHLVDRVTLSSNMEEERLEIQSLLVLNEALLGKWLWSFILNGEELLRKIIMGKFGEKIGGLCARVGREVIFPVSGKQLEKGGIFLL